MKKTTDLHLLKKGSTFGFTWGKLIKIHEIGPYAIGEYVHWENSELEETHDEKSYHIWVDGKDTCRGASSLESAIVQAIAYKFDGNNSQAGLFFMRMISKEI